MIRMNQLPPLGHQRVPLRDTLMEWVFIIPTYLVIGAICYGVWSLHQ